MDDSTIKVAVGLRLGAPLCRPHKCHHCGAEVDSLSTLIVAREEQGEAFSHTPDSREDAARR